MADAMFGAMDPVFSSQIEMPGANSGGMFGNVSGWRAALAGALAGLVSRRNPELAQTMMAPQLMRQKAAMELASYNAQKQVDLRAQMQLLPLEAQLKLMYPDNEDAQLGYQAGLRPGTPDWTSYMKDLVANRRDPLTTIPGGGMAPASVARSMMGANVGQPAPPGVTFTPVEAPTNGGPTPPASGGFLGSPYSDIGPYHRY
jgi:hypothetical protein